MKNKILFIQPPLSANNKIKYLNHQVPLGFLYMGNILEKNGFEVKILDCQLYFDKKRKIDENTIKIGLFPEDIEQYIKQYSPDIIGINCSFSMYEEDSFEVIDLIKKINKNILVVVGGAHASTNPKYVLRNKNIDIVVIGEGELTILEIADSIRKGKKLNNIKGTALRINNKIKINKARDPIIDIDSIEPAWHLIDVKKYFQHPDNSAVTIRKPSIHMITSRGCPGSCTFCSVHTVWGRKWRPISAKKVLEQIEYLNKTYGINHFRFNDDNFTIDKQRVIEICQGILDRKIDIKWDTPSGVALWTLDKEVLDIMKKSGYYRITLGLESACKETLKYINKNIDLKKANDIIDYSNKIGLWTSSFFIIGFPFEKKENIEKTFEYILKSKINIPFISIAQPYPGTKMNEDFKKCGLMQECFIERSRNTATRYNTQYFTSEELNNMREKMFKRFYMERFKRYLNPVRFYNEFGRKIKNLEDINYIFKIIHNLFL